MPMLKADVAHDNQEHHQSLFSNLKQTIDRVLHHYVTSYYDVIMCNRCGLCLSFPLFCPGVERVLGDKGGPGSSGLLQAYLALIAQEVASFNAAFRHECKEASAAAAAVVVVVAAAAAGAADNAAVTEADESMSDAKCFSSAMSQGPRDGVQELRDALALSAQGKRIPYQDCIIAMSIQGVLRHMWSTLNDQEQDIFASEYGTLFQVYVNSMPAESAAAVLERVDAGGCCVRGGLDNIVSVDRYSFRLYFKGVDNGDDSGQSVAHVDAQYVVNASGFHTTYQQLGQPGSRDLPASASPLFADMIAAGLIIPHPRGGLRADFTSGRVLTTVTASMPVPQQEEGATQLLLPAAAAAAAGKAPSIYAVGYPLKGEKLAVSGLSYCVADAEAAVSDFINHL
jgi:hypothetical protein